MVNQILRRAATAVLQFGTMDHASRKAGISRVSRRTLMSMITTIAAPAVSMPSPSIAAEPHDGPQIGIAHPETATEAAQALQRLELVISTLEGRFVADGFNFDNGAAEQVLSYFRRLADGEDDNEADWLSALAFFERHGISSDYVLMGDIAGMVCASARAGAAPLETDTAIIAAAGRFAELGAELRTTFEAQRKAGLDYLDAKIVPDGLLWREGDPIARGGWVMGRNGCTGQVMCDHADIERARAIEPKSTRVREIIAAYDRFRTDSERQRSELNLDGHTARLDGLLAEKAAIMAQLVALPAHSPAALRAKAQVLAQQDVPYEEFQHRRQRSHDSFGLAASIQKDLLALPAGTA